MLLLQDIFLMLLPERLHCIKKKIDREIITTRKKTIICHLASDLLEVGPVAWEIRDSV